MMFVVYLLVGTVIGLLFPPFLSLIMEIPEENRRILSIASVLAGWLLGVINFVIFYVFIKYCTLHFRNVFHEVRAGNFSARSRLNSRDAIGQLAIDINETIDHLEKTKIEILQDDLTGLPNRQFLQQFFMENKEVMKTEKAAFMFFDLNKFKQINDLYGHQFGDQVLISVGNRVKKGLPYAKLIRLSGDEFMLVVPSLTAIDAMEAAKQLHKQFKEPFLIGDAAVSIDSSIGISIYPDNGVELTELVKKSDHAMYEAKKNPLQSYCFYHQLTASTTSSERTDEPTNKIGSTINTLRR
ncbi:diguanylate cyclase domain-containing protein [Planococcus sp. YIM B11945]|uniref:diguanylate cyclase n=1 Tax=Planococcus sp. YIM B11945 TaxID=3435410 RepID=UPI003D7DC052